MAVIDTVKAVTDLINNPQVDEIPASDFSQDGGLPWEVDVSPDGTRVYVTNLLNAPGFPNVDNQITEWVLDLDPATGKVNKFTGLPFKFKGTGFIGGAAVGPDSSKVYVLQTSAFSSLNEPYRILVFDADNGSVDPLVLPVSGNDIPFGIAVRPDDTRLYVGIDTFDIKTNTSTGSILVIDTISKKVTASIPIVPAPNAIAVAPDGAQLYVTTDDGANGKVVVIDTMSAGYPTIATYPVGPAPVMAALTPDGNQLYVTNEGYGPCPTGSTVSVIDTKIKTVKTIGVGTDPQGLAVTPDGTAAWVINEGSCFASTGSASIIDTTTNRVVRTLRDLVNGALAFGTFIRPPPTGPVKPFKTGLPALPGDVNGDGVVDCADLVDTT